MLELQKTRFNSFYIDKLPTGVYTLDVIVMKGKTQAAYKGILVIGQISYQVLHKEITTRNRALNGAIVFQNSTKLNNE